MQFIYHKNAGEAQLKLSGDIYHHLFRTRRMRKSESLTLRNLRDCNAYFYAITNLDKKEAILTLDSTQITPQLSPKGHLIWAMIDPKSIEKTLPYLNELNLACITFFYADFSQKQFKLDIARIERILENSCEQCGRTTRLKIEILPNLEAVLQKYPKFAVMDFGAEPLESHNALPIMLGAEGGFSQKERTLLKTQIIFSAPNCNILRSETAAIYITSKLL